MKGSQKVVDLLNAVLSAEITAVSQYWVHARMCENWGYERLWKKIRAEAIDEMKHADELTERILFLDGLPNLQALGKITIGENVKEQLELDLAMELVAVKRFNDGIAVCVAEGDNGTREMLEEMLVSEEEHVNWLEAQLGLIASLGDQLYLSEQMKD
jgi:bacterioferritin